MASQRQQLIATIAADENGLRTYFSLFGAVLVGWLGQAVFQFNVVRDAAGL